MIFHYICVSQDGTKLEGNIDSLNFDTAVADLQKRGLTVVRLDEKKGDVEVGSLHFAFKKKVEQKDIVIFYTGYELIRIRIIYTRYGSVR
jgi:type II secretory pathway component PulF